MPVSNGVLDTVGFLFAGQLAHQLQRKGDGTAQTVAGGEVAVHHDLFIVDDGTGQLILEPGVGRGVFALQQAQRGQNAGVDSSLSVSSASGFKYLSSVFC